MSEQSINKSLGHELPIEEVIAFIMDSWKVLIEVGLLGLVMAIVFLTTMPIQYQALAQIQVAQLSTGVNVIANIEDPNLVIARMKLPSNYDHASLVSCGYDEINDQSAENLAKNVELRLIKGTQLLELKATGFTQDKAKQCVQSIFNNIKMNQKKIAEPIIDLAKVRLTRYSERMQELKLIISKADKSGSLLSGAYLSTKDEMRYLADEIARLNDLISSSTYMQTKLVSPIYSPGSKVSPSRPLVLIAGFLGGSFLGFLFMIGLRAYNNLYIIKRTKDV